MSDEQLRCSVCDGLNCINESWYDGTTFSNYPLRCTDGCNIKCSSCGHDNREVALRCRLYQQINDCDDYTWTYDTVCEKCDHKLCLEYCVICGTNCDEELCSGCALSVAIDMVLCYWANYGCESAESMVSFAIDRERRVVICEDEFDGWSTECHIDHDLYMSLTRYDRDDDFIDSCIWSMDMSIGENWLWAIIRTKHDEIAELFHKNYLIDEIARLKLDPDVCPLIKFLLADSVVEHRRAICW